MKTLARKRISSFWLLGGLALGLFGVILGTFADLPLDAFLYSPDALWANILAAAAPAPVFWALGAAGFLTIDVLRDGHNAVSGWIIGFLCLIPGPVYMTDSFMDELSMGWMPAWIIALLLSTLPALLYAWLMRSASRKDKIRCIWILLAVSLGSMAMVQVLKRVWMRPRYFVTVQHEEVPFVPWYSLNRSAKTEFASLYEMDHDFFRSFPSGHAQSVTCLCLWALIPLFTGKGNENLIMAASLAVIWIGMFSRMVVGAHYLSDVSAGYLITFSLFSCCCWIFKLAAPFPWSVHEDGTPKSRPSLARRTVQQDDEDDEED